LTEDNIASNSSQTPDSQTPFSGLSPELVLDAADSLGFATDGRFLGLNSYENRVYQVYVDPTSRDQIDQGTDKTTSTIQAGDPNKIVLKFYRPARWSDAQILEEHQFAQELEDAEVPCVAALIINNSSLHTFKDFRFTAFACRGGRTPNLEDEESLEWIGRFLGRIHAVGRREAFAHREALTVATMGQASIDWLVQSQMIPADLLPAWEAIANQALEMVEQRWQETSPRTQRLHGDCHVGNILWTPAGPHFVDLDDSRSGPAVQDLWMLLAGESDLANLQLKALLKGYERFCEFDRSELHLIEALRTLRLLHYSAWLARRWNDPAFPAAFPWFGTARYWQERILELREQVGAMQEFQSFNLL
jgi:Ser/Thr protein kinase RdoA (MazF antagonist)